MADAEDQPENLTSKEMGNWLRTEISNATKALELRLKEATSFVAAYTAGEMSAREAGERHWRYEQRWGEPLPGIVSAIGMTDEQIVAAIDETRHPQFTARLLNESKQSSGIKKRAPGT